MALITNGTGTTSGTIGTQTSHAHGLGVAPDFVAITETANGTVYVSAASDATNIFVKGSAASLTFNFRATLDHTIIK